MLRVKARGGGSYHSPVKRVDIDVLKAIAAAFGQPENASAEIEWQPTRLLKIIRYPVATSPKPTGAHMNGSLFTVLLQDTTLGLRVAFEDITQADFGLMGIGPVPPSEA
ncbi:Hypothetical protein NGAL_HAMBI2605_57520 [Neorhizobium galegae bv. orientalis]|nr:Hypothetical protein NGAL_HAMBI2605_57520 [Neorhizobium galegae bv. orientalis]CDZ73878.1 Hypothetical protein NGAL_HAMBI2610_55100 [Neorhizobium galegae bv. orientalis]